MARPAAVRAPVFVVTHNERPPWERQGGTTYRFVTEGVDVGVEQARKAAGGKDVQIAGGANVIQQSLNRGLLDELEIHSVPVLLGAGVRLLEDVDIDHVSLRPIRVQESPATTHPRYRTNR